MAQDLMNYEQMTQLALRGVVRDAIRRVIREDGLPGAHHFYITFLTRFPGAEIDESLAKKYPEEITIVLEHQFWDLAVNDDTFEVTLKFGGVPKYLKVPYTAVTRFHDPSVGFALQFEPPKEMLERPESPNLTQLRPKPMAAPKDVSEEAAVKPKGKKAKPIKLKPAKAAKKPDKKTAKADADAEKKSADTPNEAEKSAVKDDADKDKVVSLDAFRKK